MRNRATVLREYLKTFELPEEYVEYITNKDNNPSNLLPYHNANHCFTVAVNTIDAAQYYRLTDIDQLELIIASIFHDWGHSGTSNEAYNIQQAVNGYTDSVGVYKATSLNHLNIIRLIRATEYPHLPVVTLAEQIIQDADLLQYAHTDYKKWVEAHNEETGLNKTLSETAVWLQTQRMNTDWGRNKQDKTIQKLLRANNTLS